ncbi:MAG: EAL domain-containing protein [Alphaproteobacteria bacterium]|nr:EAL domain-containing protein [Alphaproteobacteria bacterium]
MKRPEPNRVLIVDDDCDGAEGIADLLEAQGWQIAVAHHGRGALAELERFRPQLVLVELRLGRESGLDLIARIRETGAETICLVITANADKESAIGALKVGAYDYLTKPIDPEDLFRALERAVDIVRLTQDNHRMVRELEAAKERAETLALKDSLTGLANRHAFLTQLDQVVIQSQRLGKLAAVLILDLDGFKQVNDTHGHQMGDRLLQCIAERLTGCIRTSDVVARLGGDEFAIALVNPGTSQDVTRPAELILQSVREPIVIEGTTLEIAASIGVSLCPLDADDTGELMRRADVALYAAKAAGRNAMRCYDADLDASIRERHRLESDLKCACINGEFELHFQPLMSLSRHMPCGVEALLRWRHPQRGILQPVDFLDAAEASGVIVDLGRWIVETACSQARQWLDQGLPTLRMAVNVSPRQLRNDLLVDAVEAALAATALPPACLEIELVEDAVLGTGQDVAARIDQLRSLGVQLAIDDFGTGHSSLARLKAYPVNRLKIDRSFIQNLMADEGDQAICQAALQLGKRLGLVTVAEGVETKEQLDFLRTAGCDEAQGYYSSEPLPAEDFPCWLRDWTRPPRAAHDKSQAAYPRPRLVNAGRP